jgi:hypothetical protein
MVPRYLYRVFDDQSVSQYDVIDGFVAGLPDTPFDPSTARNVVNSHMDWSNRFLTPFISTTSSLSIAEHYARQREDMGHSGVLIADIDTAGFAGHEVVVYHMQSLVRSIRAHVPRPGWNKYEYLILRQIPAECIVLIHN